MKETTKASAGAAAAERPAEQRRERMAQSFADIVGVLMRDPGFRNLRLADLEWLVLPPVMSGQWRLARGSVEAPALSNGAAKRNVLVPVATALWASVSPAVDKRLRDELDKPLVLRANEWVSGKHLWLIAVGGDRRYVPKFVKQLSEKDFKDKDIKMRVNGPDGSVTVSTLKDVVAKLPAA